MMVCVEFLRECFDHTPETGALVWKVRPLSHFKSESAMKSWNARYAGVAAGGMNSEGYMQCRIGAKNLRSHVICWALFHGEFPNQRLDHRDRNRSNNAIANLRLCTATENARNTARKNPTGFRGAFKSRNRFMVRIDIGGKKLYLGMFDTPLEAHQAYCQAAAKHHGEFASYSQDSEAGDA